MRPPRILLFFPPPSDPAQPYSSLPALAAYLRLYGCEVVMADLNIQAFHYLLRTEYLRDCADRVLTWMTEAGTRGALGIDDAEHYLRCAAALGFADWATSTGDSIAALRRHETYDSADRFVPVISRIDRALQLVSAANYPATISRHGFVAGHDVSNFETLRQVVENPHGTFLSAWLRGQVEALVEQAVPDVVGISLVYPDQFIHALTIASAVRHLDPSIHICFGGPTVARLVTRLKQLGPLLDLFDSAAVGEGEATLLELARRVVDHRPLNGISNLMVRQANGCLERRLSAVHLSLNQLPTPAYGDLDSSLYLAPEPVLLLNTSRGCYWGRCLFCDVSANASEGYRSRPIGRVVEDIRVLQAKTGTHHIMFGDLAISPSRLESLARSLEEQRLDIHWLCQARLEEGLTGPLLRRLVQSGCRGLVFGLESTTQRVLDRMQKGTRVEHVDRILNDCAAAGISVNLQAFVGFPGESEEEARATGNFILSRRDLITTASLTSFRLIPGTQAFNHAQELGIHYLPADSTCLETVQDFQVEEGLEPKEASRLAQELGGKLRAAFPVLEKGLSWNAYALLLVAHSGPEGLRLSAPPRLPQATSLRAQPGLKLLRLPYHVGELAALARPAARNQSNAQSDRVSERPTWTALERDSGRLIPLDNNSYELLRACQSVGLGNASPAAGLDLERSTRLLRLIDFGLVVESSARTSSGGNGP